ncbi:cytochrome P450 [Xylaria intraflava]|nr:cytochrome P450 [Xylaria intraflava]
MVIGEIHLWSPGHRRKWLPRGGDFVEEHASTLPTKCKHLLLAQFKNRSFAVRRYNVSIAVVPNKYSEELRLTPRLDIVRGQIAARYLIRTILDPHERLISHGILVMSGWIWLARSNQISGHKRAAKLEFAWGDDVSDTLVNLQKIMHMFVARMSSKTILGEAARRDEYIFTTAFTLRMFPPWTHPIAAQLIPSRYRIEKDLAAARQIIAPLMERHTDVVQRRSQGPKMSTRQAILTLASTHTTPMAAANIVPDLCAHPECAPVLREETDEITADVRPISSTPKSGSKQWLARLEKVDSFFIESQRVNPPILLGPQRVAMESLTLKDGTRIPKGARISWAGYHHTNDSAMNKHLAGQTSLDNLAFVYGKLACPGRAFLVGEIKLILARLLASYDFQFPEGKARPLNMFADENVFPDPSATVMMKRRERKDEHGC